MASKSPAKFKGMSQWWKMPRYVAPVIRELARGPDFSFVDGRRPAFTDKYDLERRQKQVELGEQVVRYLAEIKEAQRLHTDHLKREVAAKAHLRDITPRAKGVDEIL